MSSLMTCSGQGVVVQGRKMKKSVWSRILGINPHRDTLNLDPLPQITLNPATPPAGILTQHPIRTNQREIPSYPH